MERIADKTGFPFLFSPFPLGGLEMKNRLVALPVHTGFSFPDGRVSPLMIDFYTRLAASGAGMVVIANAAVSKDGVVSKYNLRADSDACIPGLAELASAIKKQGAIACLQLNHAGRFAKTVRPLMPSPIMRSNLSFNIDSLKEFMTFFPFEQRFSLSRNLFNQVLTWGNAMSQEDQKRVIRAFAAAAFRACEAGFDMIELHGANGYLLCQYLSAFTNKLTTGFGGDVLARTAFPLAVIREIKKRLPQRFPIGFRLLLWEWVPGGIDPDQAVLFAHCLEKEGIAYLSASAGTYNSIFFSQVKKRMARPAYLEKEMACLTSKVGIPTIIAGRITLPERAETLIRQEVADLIGLGRPLRADPDWISKTVNPKTLKPAKKIIPCINCNWCLKQVILEKGFQCSQWPDWLQMKTRLEHQFLTRNEKMLWVITDPLDIRTFKTAVSFLRRPGNKPVIPAVLFIGAMDSWPGFSRVRKEFLDWIQTRLDPLELCGPPDCITVFESPDNLEKALVRILKQCDHGQVFIKGGPAHPWQEKLVYKIRGRAVILLKANPELHRVLVPLDFSAASLLVMRFLSKTYMTHPAINFDFIHVTRKDSDNKAPDWEVYKKCAGFKKDIPLGLVPETIDVAATLTRIIQDGNYGTVVMGKSGLSGIKRRLLGGVSAGVLRKSTGQTLFFVD